MDVLTRYGVDVRNIYKEKITGTKRDREELNRMIDELKPNAVVMITDLTRIIRSTKDLLEIVSSIKTKGASI